MRVKMQPILRKLCGAALVDTLCAEQRSAKVRLVVLLEGVEILSDRTREELGLDDKTVRIFVIQRKESRATVWGMIVIFWRRVERLTDAVERPQSSTRPGELTSEETLV